ncbi:MAG: metallophosphoesterase [Steroidobacteraceae bacterium]|jgi:hypothetical protein|nr:metallophosphoesterase [Steroidobacteraceae bacterium]
MPYSPVRRLEEVPVDVVGDVHGQRQALERLLDVLGYDTDGRHAAGRRLVFVGDLGDRGPDSPGVFEIVMRAVERGGATCLLGNHELPLVDPDEREQRKAGNAWFFGGDADASRDEADFGPFRRADPGSRELIRAFCETLPLVAEHPRLRVVHACWDARSLAFIERLGARSNGEVIAAGRARAAEHLARAGLTERYPAARKALEERRRTQDWQADHGVTVEEQMLIDDLVPGEHIEQRENPVKLLTSGPERPAPVPQWLGKKWRFLERVPWWEESVLDRPTVFGHYWRHRVHKPLEPFDEHAALFGGSSAGDWIGPGRLAICVDYRWPGEWSRPALAAVRPDLGELVFWDGERLPSRPA